MKALAGDRAEHELEGASVGALLDELERRHPPLAGWILDERGSIRRHINVFVNGERGRGGHRRCGADDRVEVLPAISGWLTMTELLVGTKKGLFVLEGEPGASVRITARAFPGEPVEYAMRDPRSGRLLRPCQLPVLRAEDLVYAEDPAGEWTQAEGSRCPPGATRRSSGSG